MVIEVIGIDFLFIMEKSKSRLSQALEEFERSFIIDTMRTQDWSRKKTAEELGLPISTLKYKMARLGIYGAVPKRRNSSQNRFLR